MLNLPQTGIMIRKNKYSIIAALIILYLSLTSSQTFVNMGFFNIRYLDKMVHFGLYFFFMAVIIFEHRNSFINTRQLLSVALIPFFLGILIEFLQSGLTSSRKGDVLDAIFNSMGIATALYLWLFFKPYHNEKIR